MHRTLLLFLLLVPALLFGPAPSPCAADADSWRKKFDTNDSDDLFAAIEQAFFAQDL